MSYHIRGRGKLALGGRLGQGEALVPALQAASLTPKALSPRPPLVSWSSLASCSWMEAIHFQSCPWSGRVFGDSSCLVYLCRELGFDPPSQTANLLGEKEGVKGGREGRAELPAMR